MDLLSGQWNLLSTGPVGPLKFWNPTSEITCFSINLSYRMNQCHHFNWIHWYLIRVHELIIERDFVLTFYKRASESLVGPVEFWWHWSGGPVGWKCYFRPLLFLCLFIRWDILHCTWFVDLTYLDKKILVGQSVYRSPITCGNYNWRTINPIDLYTDTFQCTDDLYFSAGQKVKVFLNFVAIRVL